MIIYLVTRSSPLDTSLKSKLEDLRDSTGSQAFPLKAGDPDSNSCHHIWSPEHFTTEGFTPKHRARNY